MPLLPYGSSRHANLVTKFGPAQGKTGGLMPYGSLGNGALVAKVQASTGKRAGRVLRINATNG